MRFEEAKNRFHNKQVRYPERGRALGNHTYLRKINDAKYEIWMAQNNWRMENDEWTRTIQEVSLFTVEPYGEETLLTITNTKYNNLTASYRISKWGPIRTCIVDREMRFFTEYGLPYYSLPVLKQGMQFIVNKLGSARLKEGQPLQTSARFTNKELAKPVNKSYNKLLKFGQMLTAIEAITFKDVRETKFESPLYHVKKVLNGETEPTIASVCEVIKTEFWFNQHYAEPNETPVPNQRGRFERGLRKIKKKAYKEIGVYQAKEYVA